MISSLVPSNLSVPRCDFSTVKNNVTLFNHKVEPENTPGYLMLNPNVYTDQYDPTYEKVKPCECPNDYGDFCKKELYITNDPRLISVAHGGQYLLLDKPPINGAVNMADVYTKKNDYKTGYYDNYYKVKSGQILYYIDGDIKDPLFEPLYDNKAEVTGYVYRDPMNGLKPYYYREPVIKTDVYLTNSNNPDQYNQLTWIRDSQESREDIMSKQMDLTNRKKYSSRWF